jgi:hypothetical protein
MYRPLDQDSWATARAQAVADKEKEDRRARRASPSRAHVSRLSLRCPRGLARCLRTVLAADD